MRPPFPVWDLHCHLLGVPGRTPEEKMARLLAVADRVGVEKLCLFFSEAFLQTPSADQLRTDNDYVLKAIAGHEDRVYGFCYVSPEHVAASLREIERCVAKGPMVGIKLWVAKRADDAALDAIVEAAAAAKAVIFQHTWFKQDGTQLAGESTPLDLLALAKRHPQTRFICGHAGGQWELGIRAIRGQYNISIETAGFDPTAGFLEMAVRELGALRIVYGSDVGGRGFASQLAKVVGADVLDEAKRRILCDNLRDWIAPALEFKRRRK